MRRPDQRVATSAAGRRRCAPPPCESPTSTRVAPPPLRRELVRRPAVRHRPLTPLGREVTWTTLASARSGTDVTELPADRPAAPQDRPWIGRSSPSPRGPLTANPLSGQPPAAVARRAAATRPRAPSIRAEPQSGADTAGECPPTFSARHRYPA